MRFGVLVLVLVAACGPKSKDGNTDATGDDDAPNCVAACSADGRAIECGNAVTDCADTEFCDPSTVTCANACDAADKEKRSVGCDYYATSMDVFRHGDCFAAFVANTWVKPAHITVKFQGTELPIENFARIPAGAGGAMTFGTYDAAAGLGPGEVAVLFLGGTGVSGTVTCPVTPAVAVTSLEGTGLGASFEISTDVPVVSYQINPFGGGDASTTGASLLLPTSVWGTSYVAVNAFPQGSSNFKPSLNMIASEDNTTVTIVPIANVVGGNGVPSGNQGLPLTISLAKGQFAQITQTSELTGSVVSSNKPIGMMAGQPCMQVPITATACDHGEQMIPPVPALGHQYAGVMYRPRAASETQTFWRVVGVVDGTQLTYSATVGGPTTLGKGQVVQFETGTPFTVTAQDANHPFMLFAYMTGSGEVGSGVGLGDPDFVLTVPPDQYLAQYVFFTDPTYPETDLVVVRKRDTGGVFHDVTLDCAGALTGWTAVGSEFEFTRVDLTTGNFQNVGNCSTGRREIHSDVPFGLSVWGWGSGITSPNTRNVSYGYPGGMNVQPINTVIL
jgi:hypothetical protein